MRVKLSDDESGKDLRYINMDSVKEFHAFEVIDQTTVTKTLYKIKFYYKNETHEVWTSLTYKSKEERDRILKILEHQLDIWDINKTVSI